MLSISVQLSSTLEITIKTYKPLVMHPQTIYSIIFLLFLGPSVFGQDDPCERHLDPNRTGSIVLPDGKNWCDVASETGSAYAKCKCEHSQSSSFAKATKDADIKSMYAKRDALRAKAIEAKQNAYQITLTEDSPHFESEKQAKISYLEDYIRYTEQMIGLLSDMNQQFQMTNNITPSKQDVAHTRDEINRLREKKPASTLSITGASDKTAQSSSNSSNRSSYSSQSEESIYQKRQREAQEAERARAAEVQRRVAASQRQYEQTMANKQRASNYISGAFESQYANIRNAQERKWQEIENQRAREQREWEERERREAEERRVAAEEKRIESAKSSFLGSIADVKIPLFFDQPQAYGLFVSKTGNETITIIPVILYKNTDNQLPYKVDVIKHLKEQYGLSYLNTHGIYSSYEQLKTQVDQLNQLAKNHYINVTKEKQIEYGKKQSANGNDEDFWGTQKTKTKPKSKKTDDFWD